MELICPNCGNGKLFNGEALAIYREPGDEINSAWAMLFLGAYGAGLPGDISEGIELTEQATAFALEDEAD